ncbi:hypothetical protein J6590_029189 [Homalodisca vitripennis]|nr:hypothetical protein J6590_029189 [Homalodisca vitripennis]
MAQDDIQPKIMSVKRLSRLRSRYSNANTDSDYIYSKESGEGSIIDKYRRYLDWAFLPGSLA